MLRREVLQPVIEAATDAVDHVMDTIDYVWERIDHSAVMVHMREHIERAKDKGYDMMYDVINKGRK